MMKVVLAVWVEEVEVEVPSGVSGWFGVPWWTGGVGGLGFVSVVMVMVVPGGGNSSGASSSCSAGEGWHCS